ncbi:hypothetical protein FRC17_008783 [Serendipita sp. 399]|nr:hypothetical protein FRC17_008783 [Serendipita sp. 399]
MAVRKKELDKKFKCTTTPTTLLPVLATLPAFIVSTSIAYSTASLPEISSNAKLDEMLLFMPYQEYFPVLPIGIAIVGMLNTEIGTWSPKSLKQMRDGVVKRGVEDTTVRSGQSTDDALEVKPGALATSIFRGISFTRGAICFAIPGTVHILWFTSSLFGLLESLVFHFLEKSMAQQSWGRNNPLLRMRPKQMEQIGVDLSPVAPLERLGQADYGRNGGWTAPHGTTIPTTSELVSRAQVAAFSAGRRASQTLRSTASSFRGLRPADVPRRTRESKDLAKGSRREFSTGVFDWLKEVVARGEERRRKQMRKVWATKRRKSTEEPKPSAAQSKDAEWKEEKGQTIGGTKTAGSVFCRVEARNGVEEAARGSKAKGTAIRVVSPASLASEAPSP